MVRKPRVGPRLARKGNKRERTRARLVEAAVQVIREKGYDRTTLEEVAVRAGMTRGAIYGNFKNREDLFLAIVETRWKPIAPPLKHGASLKEQLRIIGKALVTALPSRRTAAVGAASFQVYVLTHPQMQARLVRENKAIYKWAEKELLRFVPQAKLPMPANRFVRVLHALSDGLASVHSMFPELITEDVIISAFEALA
jgi:AcrR family transcriptional regulator